MQVLFSSGETQDVFLFVFFFLCVCFKSSEYVVFKTRWRVCWSGALGAQRRQVFKFYFFMCKLAIIFICKFIKLILKHGRLWTGDEVSRHCSRFTKEGLSHAIEHVIRCPAVKGGGGVSWLSTSCCQHCSDGTRGGNYSLTVKGPIMLIIGHCNSCDTFLQIHSCGVLCLIIRLDFCVCSCVLLHLGNFWVISKH